MTVTCVLPRVLNATSMRSRLNEIFAVDKLLNICWIYLKQITKIMLKGGYKTYIIANKS